MHLDFGTLKTSKTNFYRPKYQKLQADLSKRKGARTEETVLTPKLKKFNYSIAQEVILCTFLLFFQIKRKDEMCPSSILAFLQSIAMD